MLTVICLTYCHAPFILDTLGGFVKQKTSFPFSVAIFDDCSPDKTMELILSQIPKYSQCNRIQYFRQKKNIGANLNGFFALQQVCSEYIAHCEGDDYWTDEHKLEKQVSFLKKNRDFVLTFHNTLDLHVSGPVEMYKALQSEFDIEDFIRHTYARSVSVVYRRVPNRLPNALTRIKLGDSAWFIYLLQFGRAKFFSDVMAHYRIHSGGIWSGRGNSERALLRFELFLGVLEFIDTKYEPLVKNELYELSLSYFANCLRSKKFKKAMLGLKYFLKSPVSFKVSKLSRLLRNRSGFK